MDLADRSNSQLIYLPAVPTPQIQSFSAPILNLQDTHIHAPFFGANGWMGILQPVTGGGIPPHHAFVEMKMIFKEGGAFDFASTFERLKENLVQALDVARESGLPRGADISAADLEQLPAYEEIGVAPPAAVSALQQPIPISQMSSSHAPLRDSGTVLSSDDERSTKPTTLSGPSTEPFPPPHEPPPGYEETQHSSIADNLEQSIRRLS